MSATFQNQYLQFISLHINYFEVEWLAFGEKWQILKPRVVNSQDSAMSLLLFLETAVIEIETDVSESLTVYFVYFSGSSSADRP